MPLDADKIKELLAKKNAPRTGGGGGRKKAVDFNDDRTKRGSRWNTQLPMKRSSVRIQRVTILTVSIVKCQVTSLNK